MVVGDTQVQPQKFTTLYESVIITGKMVPAEDPQASLLALIEKYSPDFLEKGLQYIQAAQSQTGVYTILPQSMTGKANRAP